MATITFWTVDGETVIVDEDSPLEQRKEADLVYAFCHSRLGHQSVQVDSEDRSVGIFGDTVYCEDCGVDLSNDTLYNSKEI